MNRSSLQIKEEAMYGKDLNSSEERLRRRIRNAIAEEERPLPTAALRPVEDGVLALMRDYVLSPVEDRQRVYEEHEQQVLKILDVLHRTYSPGRSSGSGAG